MHEVERDIWFNLASYGCVQPDLALVAEGLPLFTVGINAWLDRLSKTYLNDLSTRRAHHKLVLAPYGGGKTHFLLALALRAQELGFAVAYISCQKGTSFADPLGLYQAIVRQLLVPGQDQPGLASLCRAIVSERRRSIHEHAVPDEDEALHAAIDSLLEDPNLERAFAEALVEMLREESERGRGRLAAAASRWLHGEFDTLTKVELHGLHLAKPGKAAQVELGQQLLLSLLRVIPLSGAKGTVLLLDEAETLFTRRGAGLNRLLSAMRVFVDMTTGAAGGVPLLCAYAATPGILDDMDRYPALKQRLEVRGDPFDRGNDQAVQLDLSRVGDSYTLLSELGIKLIHLGELATSHQFDHAIQTDNGRRLAHIASSRSLDVDSHRLYVKTWVSILDVQARGGERSIPDDEMQALYQGEFVAIESQDKAASEP